MRSLKELLVRTIGLARLGREYAEGVQSGVIDGDDNGIALVDFTVKGSKTRSGPIDIVISNRTEEFEIRGNDVRGLFAVLHGALSAEFDEPLQDGADKPNTTAAELAIALDLLRTAQGVMGEPSEIEGSAEWFEAADKLLGNYPAPQVAT